jgi:capsular exopolysaccharide synthesis family protein
MYEPTSQDWNGAGAATARVLDPPAAGAQSGPDVVRDDRRFAVVLGRRHAAHPDEAPCPADPAPAFEVGHTQGWAPSPAGHESVAVEQYRRLAASLMRAQGTHGMQAVMVTSALAGEGKSLTAANLALTLARSYRKRVLLIDADLRMPAVHQIFRMANPRGLGEYLEGRTDRPTTMELGPQLVLLTAGRPSPDPVGGLASPRMKDLLSKAVAEFDWVIIDTPPVGLLPDARLLGDLVDAVLLVIEAGATPHAALERAIDEVGRERILGVVLNRATEGLLAGYGYQYNRYQGA